ncbi:MAG: peptide deformylase [Bryobacterales bacterium]|nr:peptide deformylase [Bryobacteraceae bacterium]MDW8129056.1 peptide deformylase [Bryobacterales bacterium]
MPARRILQLGDPMLREVSRPVESPAQVRLILRDLRATLHEFRRTHGFGRGISAVQIGEPLRVIYLEFEGKPYSLINPEWEYLSEEKIRLWDDCFSFPDLVVLLERSRRVGLRYTDEAGQPCRLQAEEALAELLQHEMDHLEGILAVDRALDRTSLATRSEWERRYRHRAPELGL